jgi:hypothetical protein
MYAFYGDESGFTKGNSLEKEQPITVYAGILIDLTKLSKAIRVFDELMEAINKNIAHPITELKFADINHGKYPYSVNYPSVESRCGLLEKLVTDFTKEINCKVIYCAVCDEEFDKAKKAGMAGTEELYHPYLASAYRVLSKIENYQKGKKNNKGHTFVILDEQDKFQLQLEKLVTDPFHTERFTQIIDTAYFGKSHFSKLIQITDLIAGIIRSHLTYIHLGKTRKMFAECVSRMFEEILKVTVGAECFESDLKATYKAIEIKSAKIKTPKRT